MVVLDVVGAEEVEVDVVEVEVAEPARVVPEGSLVVVDPDSAPPLVHETATTTSTTANAAGLCMFAPSPRSRHRLFRADVQDR